ncbi:MAG: tyrosine-type recombinase/integrase [Methylocella sp.]|nr:MAG: integrase [Hyphomicrobiales bacterium]
MPRAALTDIAVRALKPAEKQVTYWDVNLPAFGVRVGKNHKTFVVMVGRERKLVSLSHYPSTPLALARAAAKKLLANYEAKGTTQTFQIGLHQFLETRQLRNSTARENKRLLERHFLPKFCNTALSDITTHEIHKILDGLRNTPSEALHAYRVIRVFFTWAKVRKHVSLSPCEGMKAPAKDVARDRVLYDDELKKVWDRTKEIGYPYGMIVQLLILTGQRTGEIAALRWDWIDGDTITIPAAVAKNGRESRIPYGLLTKSILETVPKFGSLLFPARGHTNKPFQGFGVRKIALDKCGVENFTHHDLRRTYATNMAALGAPIHVVEKLLNHSSGAIRGVAAIYNRHAYVDEMKIAVAAYEKKLQSLFAG